MEGGNILTYLMIWKISFLALLQLFSNILPANKEKTQDFNKNFYRYEGWIAEARGFTH